jgi:hypothetical protein
MDEYIKEKGSAIYKHKKAHKRDITKKNKNFRIVLKTREVYNS